MAAALRAYEIGVKRVLLIERGKTLGGILPQCIHNGFGLKIFSKELTGPEYAQIFIDNISRTDIEVKLETMVLDINKDKKIIYTSKKEKIREVESKALILALGCRERTRNAIKIPGTRPSGIYTAGLIQQMINIEGYFPGENFVILGSGDIGLIMARRLKLEGFNVKGVFELMPFSTGLTRNIVQCLEDYDIPLYLMHTVSNIYGKDRLEGVEISKVDSHQQLIKILHLKLNVTLYFFQ